jgi:uncharacterized protein involved in exopolysaccharide biosynthesis
MSTILKEGGAIFRSQAKQLDAKEKELQKKLDEDEKWSLRAVEGLMKDFQSKIDIAEKRKCRVQGFLQNAEARAARATARAVVAKAAKDCEKYEKELQDLKDSLTHFSPLLEAAVMNFEHLSRAHTK